MKKKTVPDLLKTPSGDKWKRVEVRKRAGVLVPLFSVYSKNSVGIGDFGDLKLAIDWCCKTGNSILQLLPLNETGPVFCPYDAISSFALDPAYLSLNALEGVKELRKNFPVGESSYVDYRIKAEKLRLLWGAYQDNYSQDSIELRRFVKCNSYWINDLALFKVLKSYHGGRAWYEWEDRYKSRDERALGIFEKGHEREIAFQIWVQWQLYKQLVEVREYAKSKNVLIKGDLPILISRDSADVWAHPEFFKLEYAAGAPPDMYCAKGQRWGMPTYNWESVAKDGYRYLKEKLRYAQEFYDILRVDHVVGLFRIWSIPYSEPLENEGLNGFFDPNDEKVWGERGRHILSIMLNSTKMLLLAEDLGMIPEICPKTLKELGIPGNDVERWVKDWKVKHDFLKAQDYRELSVAMLSTHDTTNWAAWWEHEAGTVDEALFMRKCADHSIDYNYVKDKLFDQTMSRHSRLRWREAIVSIEALIDILGKRKEDIMDFIDMYENTYREKEKLWKHLKLKGPMRESSDVDIVRAALKLTLESRSIFCIQLIVDWLMLTDIFKGDPYQYRINRPGTKDEKNWSLVMPISLERMLEKKVCRSIKAMIASSGRL